MQSNLDGNRLYSETFQAKNSRTAADKAARGGSSKLLTLHYPALYHFVTVWLTEKWYIVFKKGQHTSIIEES